MVRVIMEMKQPTGNTAGKFRWATGVESSFIPHLSIDQHRWTQHDLLWREDIKKARCELGCQWLRYSIPWHELEPQPGRFNWKWSDERLEYCRDLGLKVLLDLVHFGTPTWLPDAFGDVDFPAALERFTHIFAARYSGLAHSICPVNEPLITALFSGNIGLWPPHGRTWRTYMVVLSRVAQALARSIQAVRREAPEVEVFVCDATEYPTIEASAAPDADGAESLEADLALRLDRRHIVMDLITGRVNHSHPLAPWLEEHGFPFSDLSWFSRNAVKIDFLGLDYYCHSEMELYLLEGKIRQRVPEKLAGLQRVARDYWERYHIPMMVTETSGCGTDAERCAWLEKTTRDVRHLREEGVPIIGYTWWPLLDHLDWDGALLHQIGKIHRVGIYRLFREASGVLARHRTDLAKLYRDLILQGDGAAGELKAAELTQKPNEDETMTIPPAPPRPTDYPIVAHCHLRWDGVWQRPQQFLSRLSRRHDVLFVEGPTLVDGSAPRFELRDIPEFPNVTVMQIFIPKSRFREGGWVDEQRYRLLREALAGPLAGRFSRPVQWFYDPMAAPCFLGQLDERAVVYDCMDELSQFRFAPPEILERERRLIRAADVVFVGGRKLHAAKKRLHANAHYCGCGVDFEHFSKAQSPETKAPFDIDFVPRPILGYFGVVDERLDYELIDKLSAANPHWSLALIGPAAKVDPNSLPCRANIHWLGRREYAALPAYAKTFSACLMPFALNDATEYINPTKALEYLATERPVVSTAVADVVSGFGEVVKVARSHDEFIEFCRLAVSRPEEFPIASGVELARENSWETRVSKLEEHVREALQRKEGAASVPARNGESAGWEGGENILKGKEAHHV